MKQATILVRVLFVASLIFLGACSHTRHITNNEVQQGQALYICPMHPMVLVNAPGKCPKCGMSLEARYPNNLPSNNSTGSHGGHSVSGGHSDGCH